jgi:hypothetical protein
MPSPDSSKIKIAGSGAVWYAPAGTTLPTDSTTALAAGFVNVGYLKDGFELAQDLKTKEVTGWQNLDVLRLIPTQLSRSVKFSGIETNKTSVSLAWGGATVTVGSGSVYSLTLPSAITGQEFIIVLDWNDGSVSQRIVIKRATFKDLPNVKFSRMDEINYDFTIQALVPTDGSTAVAVYGSDAGVVA